MLRAYEVAQLILSLVRTDQGDLISNLKLQKLLYYCQGLYLALYNEPLFDEPIVAWRYGPVVRSIYNTYKGSKAQHLEPSDDFDPETLPDRVLVHVEEVYQTYGQYSAWALAEFTHEEPPWANTPLNEEITHDLMREFFLTQLVDVK